MTREEELEQEIDLLEGKLIDAQVDINMKDTQILQLEKDLAAARAEIREYEVGTRTMRTLAILGEDADEKGIDPYNTGEFNAWNKAVVR